MNQNEKKIYLIINTFNEGKKKINHNYRVLIFKTNILMIG